MNNIIKIVILFCAITINSHAQQKMSVTPLHEFFQRNCDTTIMLSYDKILLEPEKYYIISKHGDSTSTFQYGITGEKVSNLPTAVRQKLQILKVQASKVPADINEYFRPIETSKTKSKQIWKRLTALKLWTLRDDEMFGNKCEQTNDKVYDGSGIKLYLITKNRIKQLYFYEPKFYLEKNCPGREDRKRIIAVEKLLKDFFEPSHY